MGSRELFITICFATCSLAEANGLQGSCNSELCDVARVVIEKEKRKDSSSINSVSGRAGNVKTIDDSPPVYDLRCEKTIRVPRAVYNAFLGSMARTGGNGGAAPSVIPPSDQMMMLLFVTLINHAKKFDCLGH